MNTINILAHVLLGIWLSPGQELLYPTNFYSLIIEEFVHIFHIIIGHWLFDICGFFF